MVTGTQIDTVGRPKAFGKPAHGRHDTDPAIARCADQLRVATGHGLRRSGAQSLEARHHHPPALGQDPPARGFFKLLATRALVLAGHQLDVPEARIAPGARFKATLTYR